MAAISGQGYRRGVRLQRGRASQIGKLRSSPYLAQAPAQMRWKDENEGARIDVEVPIGDRLRAPASRPEQAPTWRRRSRKKAKFSRLADDLKTKGWDALPEGDDRALVRASRHAFKSGSHQSAWRIIGTMNGETSGGRQPDTAGFVIAAGLSRSRWYCMGRGNLGTGHLSPAGPAAADYAVAAGPGPARAGAAFTGVALRIPEREAFDIIPVSSSGGWAPHRQHLMARGSSWDAVSSPRLSRERGHPRRFGRGRSAFRSPSGVFWCSRASLISLPQGRVSAALGRWQVRILPPRASYRDAAENLMFPAIGVFRARRSAYCPHRQRSRRAALPGT